MCLFSCVSTALEVRIRSGLAIFSDRAILSYKKWLVPKLDINSVKMMESKSATAIISHTLRTLVSDEFEQSQDYFH